MIKYLELENFKSFKSISLDLSASKNKTKRMAFIYGENGVGKTNLVEALIFLRELMNTLNTQRARKTVLEMISDEEEETISKKTFSLFQKIVEKVKAGSLSNLYETLYRRDAKEPMIVKLGISLDYIDADYQVKLSDNKIIEETLYGPLKMRKGKMFSISEDNISLSDSIFTKEYQIELKKLIKRYWGKHSLFAILSDEEEITNNSFLATQMSENLKIIRDYIYNLSILSLNNNYGIYESLDKNIPFPTGLAEGEVDIKYRDLLLDWEEAIDSIFTSLYSDIQKVYYKMDDRENEIEYMLMVKKNIDGDILEIPFSDESRGTRKILDIIPLILAAVKGRTVIVDEIDTGIHDLLMKNIIENLQDQIQGQFIVTTHNTYLLNHLYPNYVYIISSDASGKKAIYSVSEYEKRPQKNNNLRNMYLRGDFEGIPYCDNLDFEDITDILIAKLTKYKEAK